MLHPQQLEEYRRMTPGERLALSLEMLEETWPTFMSGTPEQVDRKFALIELENNARNENLLKAFARLKE